MKNAMAWIATTVIACTAIIISGNAAWSLIALIPGFISLMVCMEELDDATRNIQEKERREHELRDRR